MKAKYTLIIATLMLLFSFSLALAEDSDDNGELDATMRLMDDAEANLPEAVTKPIQLPEHLRVSTAAADKTITGHAEANAARENQHRKDGRDKANDARERASDMAEGAKDDRESRGRSGDPPEPPDPPNPGGPPG